MASSATNEALLREILTGHAQLNEKVTGLQGVVESVKTDAREARDAARESAAATKAQDLPAKIAELRGQVEKMASDSRSDLVNSIAKVTAEMRSGHGDHEGRIATLEAARNKFAGATGLMGWLGRNAPWMFTGIAAAAALFGLRDHQP